MNCWGKNNIIRRPVSWRQVRSIYWKFHTNVLILKEIIANPFWSQKCAYSIFLLTLMTKTQE